MTLATVLPLEVASSPFMPPSHEADAMLYELQPATALPIVDFSISMKSRMLNRMQLDTFDGLMRRYRRPLVIGYALGVAVYPFMFIVPFAVSHGVAAFITAVCTVPTISLFSTLRYNMVKLMLATFDFWFCTIAAWSTAVILAMIVAEAPARAVAIPVAFAGVEANIMIDANLRGARNWVWVNCIGLSAYLFLAGWCTFGFIPRQRTFAIARFGDHEVAAESFVGSGVMTVCAVLARNILRKYRATKHVQPPALEQPGHKKGLETVECVSYRTMLRYVPHGPTMPNTVHDADTVIPFAAPVLPRETGGPHVKKSFMQQLCHPRILDVIDPRKTTSRKAFALFSRSSLRPISKGFHAFGLGIAVMTFASGIPQVEFVFESTAVTLAPRLQITLLTATLVYCVPFFALYHRQVWKKITKSFNFLFLDAQITAAHVCVCDFFRWTPRCVTLVMASWLWTHWVLWHDALTPLARVQLGFHIRYAAPIFTLCVGAASSVVYVLVVYPATSSASSDDSTYFDRVVWTGAVFGQTASFRVVPFFFSCGVTAFPLALRLLWRLYTVPNDVLVVLDGAVVYSNYMTKRNGRSSSRARSRRWGSFRPE